MGIMQVAVEPTGTLERTMKVEVPFESIEAEINKRVKEATKKARLDGFRPGKVPEKVIRERFGLSLESEAINEIVRHSLFDALQKEKLMPAGQPELKFDEAYKTGSPFHYTAIFEIFPEVPLHPFSDLVIEKLTADITDEDLEKTLEGMQKQQILWKEVDRAAKLEDRVWIDFEGKINGVPFDGGKAQNVTLILGSNSMIPGFEEGLIGVVKGQDLTLEVTFPENYHVKDLANKASQFITHVHKVEEPLLPEVNDEFAEKFGIKEGGVAKLREQVKETLAKQLTTTLRNQLKSEVMTKLSRMYKDLEVPKALVHKEAHHLMHQMQQQFAQLKGGKIPDLKEDLFMDRAKERVILGLVVNKLVEHYQIQADAAHVRKLIENIAERYDQPEKVVRAYYNDKRHLAEIESLAIEDHVVDKILTEAMVVEKPGKASEILQAQGVN